VIVPLNPCEYEGGLYIQQGASRASRLLVDPSIRKGDALFHRFQVRDASPEYKTLRTFQV
jgi:hypothetical protein